MIKKSISIKKSINRTLVNARTVVMNVIMKLEQTY